MARLYFKGDSAGRLAGTFNREGKLVGKRALRNMRRVSKLVMEQSKKNAPVDWKGRNKTDPPGHELERSHKVEEQYADDRRLTATVVVGGIVGGVNVDAYAQWLHDDFSWSLGPASRDKAGRGNDVGPLFLERALTKYEDEFDDMLDQALGELLR